MCVIQLGSNSYIVVFARWWHKVVTGMCGVSSAVSSVSRLFFFIWRKSLIFFFRRKSSVKKKTRKCMVRDLRFFL